MKAIKIIHSTSKYYPKSFFKIKPPPEFLFAAGNIDLLNTYKVAVVGARACSDESIIITEQLVNELSTSNITVVSGMADGIDSIAHKACIKSHGKTIAILGSGFNKTKNKKLFREIIDNGGLIISEYFPDIPAMPYNFPRRNCLLVGMSKCVIAIEVHTDSGTMITAKEALAKDVPLLTIPGDIFSKRYEGNNWLIQHGAKCITSFADLFNELKKVDANFVKPQKTSSKKAKKIPDELKHIYSVLEENSYTINRLSQVLNMPVQELQPKLLLMELDNLIINKNNHIILK